MEGGGWRVEGGAWRVEGGAWRVEGGAWSVEGGGWSVEGGGWSVGRRTTSLTESDSRSDRYPGQRCPIGGSLGKKRESSASAQRHNLGELQIVGSRQWLEPPLFVHVAFGHRTAVNALRILTQAH